MSSLATFGETMVRLSVPEGQRLRRTDRLDVHVGGAESNVAAAAATLGVDATWLSRLPETELGRRIAYELDAEGVRTSVDWTDEGRVGTYYLEAGGKPRGSEVVYDRTGTPIRSTTPETVDVGAVRDADAFFCSGITPALSPTTAKTTAALLSTAREAGATTALDVNYRAKLWDPSEARMTLRELFGDVDVLFVARRDAREVFGVTGSPEAVVRGLDDRHGFETVVLTQGDDGATALAGDDVHRQAAYETETVDPVGSGDAFVGGFLAARLDGESVETALAYGAATASLARTIEGDMALVSRAEIERVVDGGATGLSR